MDFSRPRSSGKLKELDVSNLFMQTFENAAAHGGISKIMKRPAAKKTAEKDLLLPGLHLQMARPRSSRSLALHTPA